MKDYMGKKIRILIPPKFRRIILQHSMKKNYNLEWSEKYSKELDYIKEKGKAQFMPYAFIEKYKNINLKGQYDKNKKLPFVIHNQKKLYFPKNMSIKSMINAYIGLLIEQDSKSPHKYFDCQFNNKDLKDSIFVDCGAAEGLISLEVVEQVKKIYIIECSKAWTEPLKATFEPWKDKIVFIRKNIGNIDNENSCKLDTLLYGQIFNSLVIKMDIEGAEKLAIEGAKKILSNNNYEVLLSVCTYHSQEDYKEIKNSLKSLKYEVQPSNGYVLWYFTTTLKYPYFRKCLVRAYRT